MRILFLGNSHSLSVIKAKEEMKHDLSDRGISIDIIPLNFTPTMKAIKTLMNGQGKIIFSNPVVPTLDYDVRNYDAFAWVGAYLGGDAMFRPAYGMTCFSILKPEVVAVTHPSFLRKVLKGRRKEIYFFKPPVLFSPGLNMDDFEGYRMISHANYTLALEDYMQYVLSVFQVKILSKMFPRTYWFESPRQKRAVFSSCFGDTFANSDQVPTVVGLAEASIKKLVFPEGCCFVPFPQKYTEDGGVYLRPEYRYVNGLGDIHMNSEYGKFIFSEMGII